MERASKSDRRSLWGAGVWDRFGSRLRSCRIGRKRTRPRPLSRKYVESEKTTKAVPNDTAGKLREATSRPGGARDISRWRSEAQPPANVFRASGAGGVCQRYPERPHSKGFAISSK